MSQKSEGLAGVVAGDSAISTVGKGLGLNYRGYAIEDLCKRCTYEDVAHLLVFEKLPTRAENQAFLRKVNSFAAEAERYYSTLEKIPREMDPMDVVHIIVMEISAGLPESPDFSNQKEVFMRILGLITPCLLYWHHFAHSGLRIDTRPREDETIAALFLRLLHLKDTP